MKMTSTKYPLRILTATCLFDGHDAAINIVRRLLQARGVEVIHLGINRSVHDVVTAALQEDVDAIAMSSYQGGHNAYFGYLLSSLADVGAKPAIFVGGGATISSDEARKLEVQGVSRVYTSADVLSLDEMISDLLSRLIALKPKVKAKLRIKKLGVKPATDLYLGQLITAIEQDRLASNSTTSGNVSSSSSSKANVSSALSSRLPVKKSLVMGITGTGGAGKSTFSDELLTALLQLYPDIKIAYLAVDPSAQKTGGALLGDRIRINTLPHDRLFMRSIATRQANVSVSQSLQTCVPMLISQGFDLVLVETAGIGQSDSAIVDMVDFSLYLMTKDYGASSQLEKIEMLQYADAVVLNKADQQGSEDAFNDVQQQWRFNQQAKHLANNELPVFPMVANHYNDHGFGRFIAFLMTKLPFPAQVDVEKNYQQILTRYPRYDWTLNVSQLKLQNSDYLTAICNHYTDLSESNQQQIEQVRALHSCYQMLADLGDPCLPTKLARYPQANIENESDEHSFLVTDASLKMLLPPLRLRYNKLLAQVSVPLRHALLAWFRDDEELALKRIEEGVDTIASHQSYGEHKDHFVSLSGTVIPHVAKPVEGHWDNITAFLLNENCPGQFPYTAGVFPKRHNDEDPTRMFAGEGLPEDTNKRFHYLIKGQKSIRLSTAFDPNTLYGHDPAISPDVFACIGMSGVSIATLDDMKVLYSGIDLCDASSSVSMTINGPAPILMAWFLHTAIDQQVELYLTQENLWSKANKLTKAYLLSSGCRGNGKGSNSTKQRPTYRGDLPQGHDGLGLKLLGISGQVLMTELLGLEDEYTALKTATYHKVRGTLQADILKEEIAQNECIFSLDFALKLMADMQGYFSANAIAKFYPVSVSGYHIGEAGANPITQLAFTLANGFTLLEYYLAQGLDIDDVAPRLSFFFSNGMDPEYAVIGRVARRIWARTLKSVYNANERSQKLKYHIQTSGRSLQSQEIDLNDIRTSLQAIYALCDNCNSLHTNAYDETITTPTENSVYRALSIQSIINREFGLNKNQNPLQGSYVITLLTDLVEEAVYGEFNRLARRGGVLGAIESGYQRTQIQQQSMYYEKLKGSSKLDMVGVNCMSRDEDTHDSMPLSENQLVRCSDNKKQQQIDAVLGFKQQNNQQGELSLAVMKVALLSNHNSANNSFAALMGAAPFASLSQLTDVLYAVGGKYRRNM
ncbi:methylmalonyl-CoA mutase family protein [Moritella sp. Urea-trap-13]|uniref:methylmalonyl-CoA mutase family protein n=1 Tax=Moritella sp. Urea-trap-13 TaxID=2058327 RepID=UPI000C33472C|nr:methylmalonyl-CoA mutase family protein [Moritella sp. Urea-trap-13]PKH06760.1 methylmalonyl-CoA mutase [Moritella sp. Urea-trap-13]